MMTKLVTEGDAVTLHAVGLRRVRVGAVLGILNMIATLSFAGSVSWVGSGGGTWTQPDSDSDWSSAYGSGDLVTFSDTASGTTTVVPSGTPTPGSVTVTNVSKAYTFNTGGFGGSGGLTKNGSGTLTLNAANSYDGTTTINKGQLTVGHGGALGTTAGGTVVNGGVGTGDGTLNLTGGITVSGEGLTLNGSGSSGYSGALISLSGTNTWAGLVTLGSRSWATANGGALVLSGGLALGGNQMTLKPAAGSMIVITNAAVSGSGVLEVGAPGTLSLSVAGNAWGGTSINSGGTLRTDVTNALPATTTVTLGSGAAGGTLDLNGNSQVIKGLATSGTGINACCITSPAPAVLTLNSNGSFGTYTGRIDGAVALLLTNKTTGTLGGNNSYTGVTTIADSSLTIAHSNALGATSGITEVKKNAGSSFGGQLKLTNSITVPEKLTLAGQGYNSGYNGALNNASGSNTLTGVITANDSELRIQSAGGTLNIAGGIAYDTASGNLFQTAGGDLLLSSALSGSQAGTYFGHLGNGANRLIMGIENAWRNTLYINQGVVGQAAYSVIDLNGFNQTVSRLVTQGTDPTLNMVTNSSATPASLTFNNSDARTYDGRLTGNMGVTKINSGELTLTHTNTYSGATVVTQGVLRVTHPLCIFSNSTVYVWKNAKMNLDFNGTNVVNALYIDGVLQYQGVYGKGNRAAYFDGAGYLLPSTWMPPKGTLIRFF